MTRAAAAAVLAALVLATCWFVLADHVPEGQLSVACDHRDLQSADALAVTIRRGAWRPSSALDARDARAIAVVARCGLLDGANARLVVRRLASCPSWKRVNGGRRWRCTLALESTRGSGVSYRSADLTIVGIGDAGREQIVHTELRCPERIGRTWIEECVGLSWRSS